MKSPDNPDFNVSLESKTSTKGFSIGSVKNRVGILCAVGVMVLNIASCGVSPEKRAQTAVVPPTHSAAVIPTAPSVEDISDFLKPKTIREGANVAIYKQGGVVNLVKGADVTIQGDILQGINIDPSYGIGLTSQDVNLTFLFPQSFATSEGREQAVSIIEEEMPIVMLQHSVDNNMRSGKMRFSIISVGDVLINLAQNNPNILPYSIPFLEASGTELSSAYLAASKSNITDYHQIPSAYPATNQERLSLLRGLRYPFKLSINPNYLTALGLSTVTRGV